MAVAPEKTHEDHRIRCRQIIDACVLSGARVVDDVPADLYRQFKASWLRLLPDDMLLDVFTDTIAAARLAEMLPDCALTGTVNPDAQAAFVDAVDEYVRPHFQRELDRANGDGPEPVAPRSGARPSERRLARLQQEGLA